MDQSKIKIQSGIRSRITPNIRTFQPKIQQIPLATTSWQSQVMTALPLALFIATLIQIIAVYKYFDLSIYDNQSTELIRGSINTLWEKIFVVNSIFIVFVNFIGLVGVLMEKKWSFAVVMMAAVLSTINAVVMLNPICIIADIVWIVLLLRIRKEFE